MMPISTSPLRRRKPSLRKPPPLRQHGRDPRKALLPRRHGRSLRNVPLLWRNRNLQRLPVLRQHSRCLRKTPPLRRYSPSQTGAVPSGPLPLALRTLFQQLHQRAAQARAAAQGMGDPCLQQLFQDLGEDAEFYAQRLRALLEEMP